MSLLYDGALRLREIVYLRRDQIDLDAGCIRLRQSKTKTLVTVYLRPATLALLCAHLDRVRDLEKSLGRVLLPDHALPRHPAEAHRPAARQHRAHVADRVHQGRISDGARA